MSWNDEKVAKLKELWGKGNTASQIAEIIGGMTRNAVIEEELKNYQAYMKNAQMKFTKTVKKLKTHLSFWKKKAVAAGVSPDLKP
mgnify:CR=1 FL=1